MTRAALHALTLHQPVAWCIAPGPRCGPCRVIWCPGMRYDRELSPGDFLAIHAAATVDIETAQVDAERIRTRTGVCIPTLAGLTRGAIVGVAVYDGMATDARWIEWPRKGPTRDPWFTPPVGMYLRDVVTLAEPVRCRGAPGLWTVTGGVLERVRAEYKGARTA